MILRLKLPVYLTSLATVIAILFTAAPAFAANVNPALSESPVVLQKSDEVLSSRVRSYLEQRDGTTATIWVFFTDKGISSRGEFSSAASAVNMTERTSNRRAKVGLDKPLFADLPVVGSYIQGIQSLGGSHRRTSRWLNAASFDVPADKLDAVAALPYVREITPMARFKKNYDIEEGLDSRFEAPSSAQTADVLNYGASAAQLQQIHVPELHAAGINGQGVTLAIFDTGFRKTHQAFALHYAENRVLAEHDFIFNDGNTANEPVDNTSQWNHGTYIWSVSGGYHDGFQYGPAYKANFILCKTEDVRSETQVEEDNWVAALEWVDSIGADVVTSSLGYSDWYTYPDMDGATAPITLAANTAAGLGIVVCNSMGNSGPNPGTLSAPADAFDILSCGSVSSSGFIASSSSRGPTYDGRTKPEVCARGVNTACATTGSNSSYGSASGTSLSTPLVAGVACQLIQANPTLPPLMIRQSLMETASQAATPDNTYGWGIIHAVNASNWAVNFSADVTLGPAPLTVQFTNTSLLPATSVKWYFGDGDSATVENPQHTYLQAGRFTVQLVAQTTYGDMSAQKFQYIAVISDTLRFENDSAYAGREIIQSVFLANSQPLEEILIPFHVDTFPLNITVDSVTRGSRTAYFEDLGYSIYDPTNGNFGVRLTANMGGGAPMLAAGSGEVMRIYAHIDEFELGDQTNVTDTINSGSSNVLLTSDIIAYGPVVIPGAMSTRHVKRMDFNSDGRLDLTDLSSLIAYLIVGQPIPTTIQMADYNGDYGINLIDLSSLVAYLVAGGMPPVNP